MHISYLISYTEFQGSHILLDYLRTPMSIPAPVLKALWQKKKISQRYLHFSKRKLHVKTFKCLKNDLTSFVMAALQLNN